MIALVGSGQEVTSWASEVMAGGGLTIDASFEDGIYYATNPDAQGRYRFPEDLTRSVAPMSVEGLWRSDPAYLDHVLLVVDHWSRSNPDRWLVAVHDVLADVATRGLPFWPLSAVAPDWEGVRSWLGRATIVVPKPLVGIARPPRPEPRCPELPVHQALHHAIATRGNIDDALGEAIGDLAEAARESLRAEES